MAARLLIFLSSLFLTTSIVQAQATDARTDRGCGTTGKSAWLVKYQAGLIHPVEKSLETRYVPTQLTIVGTDDGSGYADPLSVLQSFQLLNEDFAEIGVQFYLDGDIAYVNSTIYNDHDEFQVGQDMIADFSRDGVFNTFIVRNPAGNCGYYSPSQDAVVMSSGCINGGDRTWSHEVGHYFGLPHTFLGWEGRDLSNVVDSLNIPAPRTLPRGLNTIDVELADGSNCAEAADGFCDTPADYLSDRWRCSATGMYPDSLLDPDSVRFAVPGNNIMSYANDRCVSVFSQEQITAMRTNLDGRLDLAVSEVPVFVAAKGEDLQPLSPADRADVQYADSVQISWNAVDNADFYLLQIQTNNNFAAGAFASYLTSDTTVAVTDILSPNRRYYWRVRPVNRYDVSGTFSEPRVFRNGAQLTATIDPALDAALVVAPNPIQAGHDIFLRANGLGSDRWTYQLIDLGGRVLFDDGESMVDGRIDRRIPTDRLSPGLYAIRISVGDRFTTRRIVVSP